jgi:putative tricarboxylic transport membrane protein
MFGLLGTFLGTLVGVLPGIGPALAIGLLLPITLTVNPTSALIMFAAIFYGAMYGGSTTSILLNTLQEKAALSSPPLRATRWQKLGRAGAALATAAIGSFVAGTIATILLAFGAPVLAEFALNNSTGRLFSFDHFGFCNSRNAAWNFPYSWISGAFNWSGYRT